MFTFLEYDFMQRAFTAGLITAVIAPAIGLYLVTRRYSFLADTLAHVSLAGVAVGVLAGINPILTAVGASVLAALSTDWLRSSRRVMGEAGLVLFLSGGLALAAVLLSAAHGGSVQIAGLLFGSIATVSPDDVRLIAVLGIVVLLTLFVLRRQLFCVSIDEDLAASGGIPVQLVNRVLLILAALTVSLSMRVIGILLVGALMIIPVLTAMQLQRGFTQTLLWSIGFSLFSVVTGLILSYEVGISSGGTIVLLAIAAFALTSMRSRRG